MKIVLEGIPANVFGGYFCLRGYAPISDLAEISKPREYQRDIDEAHQEEIKEFYKTIDYLFFPEIILGCELEEGFYYDEKLKNISMSEQGLMYKFLKSYGVGQLTVDIDANKFLHRIDGNHRLSAFEKLKTEKEANEDKSGSFEYSILEENQQIPFCVLFIDKHRQNKDAKVIFNNINYKAKPLAIEDNLKNVFDGTFTEEELNKNFGEEYVITNNLINLMEKLPSFNYFKNISQNYRESCFKIIQSLKPILSGFDVLYLSQAMDQVLLNIYLEKKVDLGLFISLVYYQYLDFKNQEDRKYSLFLNWVKKNNIDKLTDVCVPDLVNIFNKILERKQRQIFVSMPFEKPKCNKIYNAIIKVVKKISKEHNINIPDVIKIDELQKSSTFKIEEKIESAIEVSGCLIAILNHQKQNVYHEIGYAMGYFKGKGLENSIILTMQEPKEEKDWENPEYKIGFNLQGYKQLRFKELNDFEKRLEKKLLLHYGLK